MSLFDETDSAPYDFEPNPSGSDSMSNSHPMMRMQLDANQLEVTSTDDVSSDAATENSSVYGQGQGHSSWGF